MKTVHYWIAILLLAGPGVRADKPTTEAGQQLMTARPTTRPVVIDGKLFQEYPQQLLRLGRQQLQLVEQRRIGLGNTLFRALTDGGGALWLQKAHAKRHFENALWMEATFPVVGGFMRLMLSLSEPIELVADSITELRLDVLRFESSSDWISWSAECQLGGIVSADLDATGVDVMNLASGATYRATGTNDWSASANLWANE